MSLQDSTRLETVKILMLKGEKGDTGDVTAAQLAAAVAQLNGSIDQIEENSWITDNNFTNALKLETIKDYVTPEMFGAVGDGVTDDTSAVQQALNSGKSVIGTGVYKIGEANRAYYYPVTISVDGIKVRGSFIDGRTYSTTSNNKDYGAFLIDADNVELDININNNNLLPVDDADSNNLSDVGGYAVTLADGIKNAKVNVVCEHMNGVYAKGLHYNSNINVIAETSAYPYAGICAIGSVIHINANKCHRAFWGACNGSFIYIQAQNFVSTGNSSHILVNAIEHNGVVYHCLDSVFEIIDTGSTIYNNGALYFDVYNNIGQSSVVRLTATIIGDISNSNNGVFACNAVGTGSLITGTVTIYNNMKVNYSSFTYSIIYTGVDVRVFDSQYSKITIDTNEEIRLSLNGLNPANGAVYVTNINPSSKVIISDYNAIVANSAFTINAYQFFIVNNVFTFDPSKFYRCIVNNGTKYINGTPTS